MIKEVEPYVNQELLKEEYFEKTLYKIQNEELKEIYIPKSDLI